MAEMDTNQDGVEETTVVQAPSAEATVLGTPVVCPVCGTENSPSEKYCGDCGFLLSSTPGEAGPVSEAGPQAKLAGDGREFVLQEGENVIGREDTDVLLEDPSVSRRHALLVLEGGSCWVEDLGSTNGTFVDGQQIAKGERVELASGAELKLGSIVLTLDLPAAKPEEGGEESAATEEPVEEAPEPETATEEVEEPVESDMPTEEVETPAAVGRLVTTAEPAQEFPIVPGANRIGRYGDNDIALADDPYVSGEHAEIIADAGEFWLVDVGSTNSTVLNGTKIEPDERVALSAGDEIIFGRTAARFEAAKTAEDPGLEGSS